MPRKRRARRRKKNTRNHQNTQTTLSDCNQSTTCDILRACLENPCDFNNSDADLNLSNALPSPTQTPSPKILEVNSSSENQLYRKVSPNNVSYREDSPHTPINQRKGLKLRKALSEHSPEYFHLNTLYSSGLNLLSSRNTSIHSDSISYSGEMHQRGRLCKFSNSSGSIVKIGAAARSNSSIPKLHSPGLEKIPLKANISTQTFSSEHITPTLDLITETPKISQALLLDEKTWPEICVKTFEVGGSPVGLNSIYDLKNLQEEDVARKSSSFNKLVDTESLKHLQSFNSVLLSAGEQTPEHEETAGVELIDKSVVVDKTIPNFNISETEASFFNSQIYNFEGASTPIQKPTNACAPSSTKVATILDDAPAAKEILGNIPQNISEGATAFGRKFIKNKKFAIAKKCSYPINQLRSSYPRVAINKSVIPATWGASAADRCPTRLSKSCSPIRHFAVERPECFTGVTTYWKHIARIKRWNSKYFWKLPGKILDICTWLGLTIRKGFASLTKLRLLEKTLLTETPGTTDPLPCSGCESYRSEVAILKTKVDNLTTEVITIRQELFQKQDNNNKIVNLTNEWQEMKSGLSQFENIQKELQDIKRQLSAKVFAVSPVVGSCTPAPPPPPPPMPSYNIAPTLTKLVKGTAFKSDNFGNENARPVISIDDIKRVKLRKIGDRQSPRRRSTQPLVSTEMLQQVRLRPAVLSRTQTPLSSVDHSSISPSLSTSPHSSLLRILTNVDTNVGRVKRLRRVGGYSFDDVYRRNLLRRERLNSES